MGAGLGQSTQKKSNRNEKQAGVQNEAWGRGINEEEVGAAGEATSHHYTLLIGDATSRRRGPPPRIREAIRKWHGARLGGIAKIALRACPPEPKGFQGTWSFFYARCDLPANF